MLIQERLDAGLGPAVDAKRLVVGAGGYALSPEISVFQEDAWARVFFPIKRIHTVSTIDRAFLRRTVSFTKSSAASNCLTVTASNWAS